MEPGYIKRQRGQALAIFRPSRQLLWAALALSLLAPLYIVGNDKATANPDYSAGDYLLFSKAAYGKFAEANCNGSNDKQAEISGSGNTFSGLIHSNADLAISAVNVFQDSTAPNPEITYGTNDEDCQFQTEPSNVYGGGSAEIDAPAYGVDPGNGWPGNLGTLLNPDGLTFSNTTPTSAIGMTCDVGNLTLSSDYTVNPATDEGKVICRGTGKIQLNISGLGTPANPFNITLLSHGPIEISGQNAVAAPQAHGVLAWTDQDSNTNDVSIKVSGSNFDVHTRSILFTPRSGQDISGSADSTLCIAIIGQGRSKIAGSSSSFGVPCTAAASPTPSPEPTPSPTATTAPTPSPTPTPAPTLAPTPTPTLASTSTPTVAATPTPTPYVGTPTPTAYVGTPTSGAPTPTPTLAATPTPTLAATSTPTLAPTPTPTSPATPTATPEEPTPTPTPPLTICDIIPVLCDPCFPFGCPADEPTPTPTPQEPTPTPQEPTSTPTPEEPTSTPTPTSTAVDNPTTTPTPTSTQADDPTATPTATSTPTPADEATATPTATPSEPMTLVSTPTPVRTSTTARTPTTVVPQERPRPSPTALPVPVSFPKTGGSTGSEGNAVTLLLGMVLVGTVVSAGAGVLCGVQRKIQD